MMMRPSERDIVDLDDDIARLRQRIEQKERAEADGRVVDRERWRMSLAELRRQLHSLEEERAVMLGG